MINRIALPDHRAASESVTDSVMRTACRILYRHKRKMVAVFLLTLAVCVGVLIAIPRSYKSEARLFIRLGKESVALDPTATTNDVINVNESRESEINSELEILRARVLLEDTVDRLGPNVVLSRGAAPTVSAAATEHLINPLKELRTIISGTSSPKEQAVERLEKTIAVSSPRKSNIILISCKANSPATAQRILAAFLDSYLTHHGQVHRTAGSYDFFVDQSELLKHQLTEAQTNLRDAKNVQGLATIEGERDNLEHQASLIDIALLDNQRAKASSAEKMAALKQLLESLPEQELAEETQVPSAAADTMRNELYKLQIREQEINSRLTEEHPIAIAVRRQVEENRRILADEIVSRNQPTSKRSEVYDSVHIALAEATGVAAAQEAEEKMLRDQHGLVHQKIRALNDNEIRLAELSRQVNLLETSYRSYATNREQARIDAAMETGRISNVNIMQPATFVAKPFSPKLRTALAAALVLAAFASLLTALASEQFDQSLKSPEQTERALNVPVLVTLPRGKRFLLVENLDGFAHDYSVTESRP